MKTKHDWSKAPSWARSARRHTLDKHTVWMDRFFDDPRGFLDYETRPAPEETCEEQEAWDQLEAARRALFEKRLAEAHCKPSEHPQKSHACQLVGSALSSQEGGGHYKDMAIQPVEYIHKNGLGFIEGAVIKYVSRHKAKNGAEDLRKAAHFIQILLELEYGQHG